MSGCVPWHRFGKKRVACRAFRIRRHRTADLGRLAPADLPRRRGVRAAHAEPGGGGRGRRDRSPGATPAAPFASRSTRGASEGCGHGRRLRDRGPLLPGDRRVFWGAPGDGRADRAQSDAIMRELAPSAANAGRHPFVTLWSGWLTYRSPWADHRIAPGPSPVAAEKRSGFSGWGGKSRRPSP